MKKDFKLNRLSISLLILGCSFNFMACSNDDENIPTPPDKVTTQYMFGDYTGKMLSLTVSPNESVDVREGEEAPLGVEISAKVKNDTVYFENFPIKDIVLSIVGDEETADQIVEAAGDVKYKIGYKPTVTEAQDSIKFVLDPKPLKLSISIPTPTPTEGEEAQPMKIEVKVSAVKGANYEIETTHLKFKFNAEEVLLGEGEEQVKLPNFTPTTFDCNMKKKK